MGYGLTREDDGRGRAGEGVDATALDLHKGLAQLLTRFDVNEYAASVRVFAAKS